MLLESNTLQYHTYFITDVDSSNKPDFFFQNAFFIIIIYFIIRMEITFFPLT